MTGLELYRRLRRFSQWDVAHHAGVHQSRIHHYEQGAPMPTEVALKLAELFGVTPGELARTVTLADAKRALRLRRQAPTPEEDPEATPVRTI